MTNALAELDQTLQRAVGAVMVGMESVASALAIALVARGHVLLQGPPGLGKTLLSKTLAATLAGRFKRVQGTADLMPSDIIGVPVFDTTRNEFLFRPGPLFADIVLFDEINRAGPKTQSALLEAMEERQVTVDRRPYPLPAGFFVIATQNPRDFEGTYPLPESQLDRFMLRIDLSYPSREHELAVLDRYGGIAGATATAHGAPADAALSVEALEAARQQADAVHVAPELVGYVLDLARASRVHPQISLGLSTRGVLALLRGARIGAGLRGSDYTTPDDVKALWPMVAAHRLVLASEALLEGVTERTLATRLLEQVPVPR